jgi:hypothetical protein
MVLMVKVLLTLFMQGNGQRRLNAISFAGVVGKTELCFDDDLTLKIM